MVSLHTHPVSKYNYIIECRNTSMYSIGIPVFSLPRTNTVFSGNLNDSIF